MSKRHIVVAGNIGAGKSTLVEILSERLGYHPYFEPVTDNPYLQLFYHDMQRWAFHSQLFFLTHRVRSHHALRSDPGSVVQDRSVYEDASVFARNLFETGLISEQDWAIYTGLYDTLVELLPKPNLVVYVRASVATLQKRIARRGRDFESSIEDAYLTQLNRLYEQWIESFRLAPILIVPGDQVDYVEDPSAIDPYVDEIETRMRGGQRELF